MIVSIPSINLLDNLSLLESKIDNMDDFAKIMDDLTATHANRTNTFRGTDWAIEVATKPQIEGKIKAFDFKPDGENFSIDIVTQSGNSFKYIECKNYVGDKNYLKESGNNFISQLVDRLNYIENLEDLSYYFHPRYQRNLKDDIIEAMGAKRSEISKLNVNNAAKLFNDDTLIDLSTKEFVNEIIKIIGKTDNFNKIIK